MHKVLTGVFLCSLIIITACDNTSIDCLKKSGSEKTVPIEVAPFHSIKAYNGINILIKEGEHQALELTSSENLIPEIKIFVDEEGYLNVVNENSCNWVRNYKNINLTVTTDTLKKIFQLGFGDIRSIDALSFPKIIVESKDAPGDVYLEVDNQQLEIVSNKISNFYLSGKTDKLNVGFYYNDGILFGKDLQAKTVQVYHQGMNTIEVHAVESVTGSIVSGGNVICHGNPQTVDVV